MATTLTPYAGEMAEQAIADTARLGRGIRSTVLKIAFVIVSIIMAGVLLKFLHLTVLVWVLTLVVIIYTGASLIGYALTLTAPVWIVNFVGGILGEENKAPEGVEAANSAVRKLWRIWLWAMSYSAVALEVIALWNIEDNMFLVVPIIAVGLLVMLLSVVLFQESMFFPWLMFCINVLLLIAMLCMALPGNVGITVTRWVDQARTATKAHKAEDGAKRAAEEAISQQRAACYAQLETKAKGDPSKGVKPVIPTQADFEKCNKIGVEEASGFRWSLPTPKPDADTAQQQSGTASKTVPVAVAAAPCNAVVALEAKYAPGETKSRLVLGELSKGRYKVVVTGMVNQVFLGEDAQPKQYCPVKPDGTLGNCVDTTGRQTGNISGATWEAPSKTGTEAQPVLPGQPYGAAVLHAFGKPILVNRDIYLDVEEKTNVAADVNVFQHAVNYTGTTGVREYTIYRCS
jgi:hypothetical protein